MEKNNINWTSVKDKPLIHISPTGTKYPTEAGKGRFLCAIPHTDMHTKALFFTIAFITLFDDCTICEIGSEDEERYDNSGMQYSTWTIIAEEITHYIPESELSSTIPIEK
jgi:hypothetical protein